MNWGLVLTAIIILISYFSIWGLILLATYKIGKLKKFKKIIIIIGLLLGVTISIVIITAIVHRIYPVDVTNTTPTNISAGDLLGFIGSFLAFSGTVLLGVVAWKQNERANDINAELQKLQQEKIVPMIDIRSIHFKESNSITKENIMQLFLDNTYFTIDNDGNLEKESNINLLFFDIKNLKDVIKKKHIFSTSLVCKIFCESWIIFIHNSRLQNQNTRIIATMSITCSWFRKL